MRRCRDVAVELGLKVPEKEGYLPYACCWSCHEDVDLGYDDALIELDDNTQVCCHIYREWEDAQRESAEG